MMPRLYSVLDTNIYRRLGAEEFASLRALERSRSVRAVASPWVALELLKHLGEPDSDDFAPARHALKRLVEHCRTYDGSNYVLSFLASPESQIAYTMMQRPQTAWSPVTQIVGFVEAAADGDDANLALNREGFQEIAVEVARIEQSFVANFWTNVVRHSIPKATEWTAIVSTPAVRDAVLAELRSPVTITAAAESIVRLAEELEGSVVDSTRERIVQTVAARCEHALRFQAEMIRRLAEQGGDLSKRRRGNVVFDIYLASSALMFAALDQLPMWVVTNDALISHAADEAGVAELVVTLDEYRDILTGGNPDASAMAHTL
ncbi:MAG: hypothetical protein M3Z05_05555 [Gemmatimonadota bacterium]|nr:hypothetical protein [Gemmatimonadota bacterium]